MVVDSNDAEIGPTNFQLTLNQFFARMPHQTNEPISCYVQPILSPQEADWHILRYFKPLE